MPRSRTMLHTLPHSTSATEKFERYLKKATRHFLYNTSSRDAFPDYSMLPVEILQMIANEVAKPLEHECAEFCHGTDTRGRISVHLFKLRLVCRTLCCTATSVFVALTQRDNFSDYRTLYLPPSSGSLKQLKKTFVGKDKIIAGLVTKVVYQITTSQREEVDEDFLYDMLSDLYGGCSGDCLLGSGICVRDVVAHNVESFDEQYENDESFALDLDGPRGRRDLEAILGRLKNLKVARTEVEDFWGETFQFFHGSLGENEAIGRSSYMHGLPVFLEVLSKSVATDLQLVGLGSHAFSELHPLELLKLGRKKNFMSSITHFELTASHRDVVMREEWMDEPELGPMRRGDRINLLLSCLKSLTNLVIGCRDDYGAEGAPHVNDAIWLQDIMNAQIWPRLRSFTLNTCNVNAGTLYRFVYKHTRVETLVLDKLKNLSSSEWLKILDLLRDNMALKEASITLSRTYHSSHIQLAKIISDYDVTPKTQFWVDVGAYVVKRIAKVEELE